MKLIKSIAIAALVLMVAGLSLGTGCGSQGPAGVGIDSVVNNGDGTFTLLLTDGSSFTTDNLTGPMGPQGLPGPSMIVAMGTIDGDGTMLQGYNVVEASPFPVVNWGYLITLAGITYDPSDYVTLVTPGPKFFPGLTNVSGCRVDSYNGMLHVILVDENGDSIWALFSFVLLEAPQSAAAYHLEVTGSASIHAGGSNELTITAKDQYGNIITSYSGTKNLIFSGIGTAPGGQQPTVEGTVPGNPTVVSFTNGVSAASAATLIAYKAETTTLDVTDGTLNSFANPGYDLDLSVTPAATSQLVVSGITDPVVAGTASSVTVTAKDTYRNIATSYTGTIHFTSTDAQATLPSNYTFQASDNGVKTFSGGITLRTVGEQWVKATDTVNLSINGQQTAITVM